MSISLGQPSRLMGGCFINDWDYEEVPKKCTFSLKLIRYIKDETHQPRHFRSCAYNVTNQALLQTSYAQTDQKPCIKIRLNTQVMQLRLSVELIKIMQILHLLQTLEEVQPSVEKIPPGRNYVS